MSFVTNFFYLLFPFKFSLHHPLWQSQLGTSLISGAVLITEKYSFQRETPYLHGVIIDTLSKSFVKSVKLSTVHHLQVTTQLCLVVILGQ